jgi:N-acetylmuramoyl-L-alanine amidase
MNKINKIFRYCNDTVFNNYVFQTVFFIISGGILIYLMLFNQYDPSIGSYVIGKSIPKEQHNLYILDAGHGKTKNSCTHNAVFNEELNECFYEYEFNKDVLDRIAAKLKENNIFFLYTDSLTLKRNLSLTDRVKFINNVKDHYNHVVVMSIHGNASKDKSARGIEIYTNLSKRNEFFTNPETFYANTVRAADLFHTNLVSELDNIIPFRKGKKYLFKEDHESQFKKLAILRNTKCYAFLFELGFFTNPQDQNLMRSEDYKNKLAEIFTQTILQIEGVK